MKKLLFALFIFVAFQGFGQTKVATAEVTQKLNLSQRSGTPAQFWWNGKQMKRDSLAYFQLSGDTAVKFRAPGSPIWSPWFKNNGGGSGSDYNYWTLGTPQQVIKYGYLYNWYAVTDVRSISSSGTWTVPTKVNYKSLFDLYGVEDSGLWPGVGGLFKSAGLKYWNDPNTGANDSLKFGSRGSGLRNGSFGDIRNISGYWSSSEFDTSPTNAWNCDFDNGSDNAYMDHNMKQVGYSLRLCNLSTTIEEGGNGTYTGNNGKVYNTVVINGVEWLSENLAETKYRNGDLILVESDNTTWSTLTTGARCSYDNDETNAFETILNSRDVTSKDTVIVKGYNGITTERAGDTLKIKGDTTLIHTPTDGPLHWNSVINKYEPFAAKKTTDPGFPYFYNDYDVFTPLHPTFQIPLKLDGSFEAHEITAYGVANDKFASMYNSLLELNNYGNDAVISMGGPIFSTVCKPNWLYVTTFGNPILIGQWNTCNNQNIIINDSTKTFTINVDTIKIPRGTPLKWLALDSLNNIVYRDAPLPRDSTWYWLFYFSDVMVHKTDSIGPSGYATQYDLSQAEISGGATDTTHLSNRINLKVDKVSGKKLSDRNFTSADSTKILGLDAALYEKLINKSTNFITDSASAVKYPSVNLIKRFTEKTYAAKSDTTSWTTFISSLDTAPSTSTSTGTKGEIRFTSTGIFICTATNVWTKCAAVSW